MARAKKQVAVKPAEVVSVRVPHGNGYTIAATKYTPKVHKIIVDTVKKGNSLRDAGLLAGLGKETLETWLYNAKTMPEKYPHFVKLAADIDQARAERRIKAVENIVTVGDSQQAGTWQANAWFLERTDPENWGRKDKIEHVNETPRTQVNTVVLIDADARETARDLLKRVAGHSGADIAIGPGSGVQLEDGGS
jgi:hypothetical protein